MPEPDIDEVRNGLERTRHLRLALDLLEETLPVGYACDGLIAELWALREKVAATELAQLRKLGQRKYRAGIKAPRVTRPGSQQPHQCSMDAAVSG
jgi:hypothetical protein